MAYAVPDFDTIRGIVLAQCRNDTGLALPDDSDAAIRADGTAAVAEGLYDHQLWIARQLFVRTADEQGLVLHAQRLNLPRLGGSLATGQITTIGTTAGIDLPLGSQLTDGNGYYWMTTADATLIAGQSVTVPVQAQAVGASWNKLAASILTWTSPVSGQQPSSTVVELSGGSDGELLESWRSRLLAAEQLGVSQGRDADFAQAAKGVAGVLGAYVYDKRRGVGSVDVAVTAQGANGGDLPSPALLAQVQAAIQAVAVANEDVRAYAPNATPLDVTCVVYGTNVNLSTVQQIISDYLAALIPAQNYVELELGSQILAQPGVTNATLTPSVDQVATVSPFVLTWFRPGNITVTLGGA